MQSKYCCELCYFYTSNKNNFDKHLATRKHLSVTIGNAKNARAYMCLDCKREFTSRHGLWSHKKKCNNSDNSENSINSIILTPSMEPTELVSFLLQENKEFKQMILDQNKTIMEMATKQTLSSNSHNTQINNTANITQHNKQKFNLNFFLNETCKDAMNITDFVNSLQIQFSDIEKVGELGYAEGISRIFMKGLKELDICKRPVHCTDLKREIVHIKNNNKWEKEISLLQKAIKIITNNNINKITDWKNAHPGCTDGENKLNDKYCKILYESMGPIDEEQEQKDFSKIIRNIAKCTVIDKANGEN